jgi:TMEM175 potassium channel family protein
VPLLPGEGPGGCADPRLARAAFTAGTVGDSLYSPVLAARGVAEYYAWTGNTERSLAWCLHQGQWVHDQPQLIAAMIFRVSGSLLALRSSRTELQGSEDRSGHGALSAARIAALCDGVFAIAMTILVLEIAVPEAETVPVERLLGSLRQLAPKVLVYVISFINLGVLWIGQHNQYHFIARTDRWFLWINISYLLLISFMPLSTALLGNYPLERIALLVYGANLLVATLVLALHWHYATAEGRLVAGRLPSGVVRIAHRRILGSAAAYALALLLSLLVPVAGLALFLAVPFVNILPFAVDRHLRHGSAGRDAGN